LNVYLPQGGAIQINEYQRISFMNKLLAALVAGLFAAGAFAQQAEPAPAAATPARQGLPRRICQGQARRRQEAQGSPRGQGPHGCSPRRCKLSRPPGKIDTQVALTPSQRQIGLMFRKEMPQGEGMLFVFEQPSVQCFWMKNTLLPLTAAFVEDDGTITNLADMKPQTETRTARPSPCATCSR
jgi:uncharacterized membrane protein (UPF0127 family)